MGSRSPLLALIADCERGVGRPERAIELARSPPKPTNSPATTPTNCASSWPAHAPISDSSSRRWRSCRRRQLDPASTGPTAARLLYAYAETLLALGRADEALQVVPARPLQPTSRASPTPRIASRNSPEVTTLAQEHDCLLLDLDGTVFRGHEATDRRRRDAGRRRSPHPLRHQQRVAERRRGRAAPDRDWGSRPSRNDVVTSAQSAARLLAAQLPPGSAVLIVGTDSLAPRYATSGSTRYGYSSDDPVAVVQGHSPQTGWTDLAEAALAIRAGALWVAANVDRTLPSERGLLPGNGSMVAALRAATDSEPQVAGKPAPTLMNDALGRGGSTIRWSSATASTPTSRAPTRPDCPVCWCSPASAPPRTWCSPTPMSGPNYVAPDLRSLHRAQRHGYGSDRIAAWRVEVGGDEVTVTVRPATSRRTICPVVRATANAIWERRTGRADRPTVAAGDDTARAGAGTLVTDRGADRLA